MIFQRAIYFSLISAFALARNAHQGLRGDRNERDLMVQDENLPAIFTWPIDILATKQSLGVCEGKCFQDKDCEGNLVCFRRNSPYRPVPGCRGGEDDLTLSNYCADPEAFTDVPTQAPSQLPSISPTLSQAPSPSSDPEYSIRVDENLPQDQEEPTDIGDVTIRIDPKALRGPTIQIDLRPTLMFYGANRENIPPAAYPLGLCEGDCDTDDDCAGDLICYQRDAAFQEVPGCKNGDKDPSKSDYCTNK